MKISKRIVLSACFLFLGHLAFAVEDSENNSTKPKYKVLIYYVNGEAGHFSVDKSFHQFLDGNHQVQSVNVLDKTLRDLDPVRTVAPNHSGEGLYNFLLKSKWNRTVSTMQKAATYYYWTRENKAKELVKKDIEKYRPDVVVSVIPIVNNAILRAAQETKTPFVLVPTDLDPSSALQNIKNPQYKKFTLALPFEHEKATQALQHHQIPTTCVRYTGFPVRKEFLYSPLYTSEEKLASQANGKRSLVLMMGGQGAVDMPRFVKELHSVKRPLHIFAILGTSDKKIEDEISKIPEGTLVTRTVLPQTDHVALLMHISSGVLTKSGSVSVNEAMRKQKPILLDHTGSVPSWEEYNHKFIKEKGLGTSVYSYNEIKRKTENMLTKEEKIRVKKNYKQLKQLNPETAFQDLIGNGNTRKA